MWIVSYIASLIGLVFGAGLIVIDFWYIRFGFSFGMFVCFVFQKTSFCDYVEDTEIHVLSYSLSCKLIG